MATPRKLSSGKWNIQVRVKGFPQRTITRDTKAECEQAAREVLQNYTLKPSNTIESLADKYLQDVMIRDGRRRGGYEATKFRLVTIGRSLNQKPLEELTKEDVLSLRTDRLKSISGLTVRLEMQLLSRFLRWAAAEQSVKCLDVVDGVKLPEPGKARSKVIEPYEYKMILDYASDKAKPIIMVAWETAMRRNEILALTPSMINFNKKVISLAYDQTKNGEAREVPLSSTALILLKQLCDGREIGEKLFTLTPYAVTQAFRRAARLAHVYGVCFHSIRHTTITRYAEKGFNTLQLQCISGHKTIAMLARYSHLKASKVADLMN